MFPGGRERETQPITALVVCGAALSLSLSRPGILLCSHDYQGDRPLLATVTKSQRKRQPTFYVWPKLRVRNGKGASNWTHVLAIFAILCWGMADGELGPSGRVAKEKHRRATRGVKARALGSVSVCVGSGSFP